MTAKHVAASRQRLSLIPAATLARQHGLSLSAMSRRCVAGKVPGAVKMGRDWMVPAGTVLEPASSGGWTKGKSRKPTS